MAGFLDADETTLCRKYAKVLEAMSEYAREAAFPEVTSEVIDEWAAATEAPITAEVRKSLQLPPDAKICLFVVDGTYHQIQRSTSFLVSRKTYSGQKGYHLSNKSHQFCSADGSQTKMTRTANSEARKQNQVKRALKKAGRGRAKNKHNKTKNNKNNKNNKAAGMKSMTAAKHNCRKRRKSGDNGSAERPSQRKRT